MIREAFEEQFAAGGARVDSVVAYQTTPDSIQLTKLKALLTGEAVDRIVFTSTAHLDEFACVFDTDDLGRLLSGIPVACLDQETATIARKFGLSEAVWPPQASFDSLADLVNSS